MRDFAQLIKKLDSTNKTNEKVAALTAYFQKANDADKLWTIAILSHRRPKRPVNTTLLRLWATEISGIPLWLFEESYHIVGDLAETIALVLPTSEEHSEKSLSEFVSEIIRVEEAEIISAMKLIWERMKIIVEPSSAVALAALLREKERFKNKKIGIIISGGNVDLKKLPF